MRRLASIVLASAALGWVGGSLAETLQTLAPTSQAPGGERRTALVVGNSAYPGAPLRNPANDARAIARELVGSGFSVILLVDASRAGLARAVRDFGDALARGGVGVFYYAGHGMQIRGKNFLVPVDIDIQREDEVEFQAMDANLVLSKMDSARNALNIMILDACRNNPFARSFRSVSQGLAQMDAPSGTLIAFATAPGSVAADGDGDNGLYTKHLLSEIRRPGLAVEQLFKNVRVGVTRETGDRQVPWESSSLKGDFFFRAADPNAAAQEQQAAIQRAVAETAQQQQQAAARDRAELQQRMERMLNEALERQRKEFEAERAARGETRATAPAAPSPQPAPAPVVDPAQIELAFWDSIKTSANPEDFRAYLERYPQGNFAGIARNRIAAARQPAAPASPPAAAAPVQVASVAPAAPAAAPSAPKSRSVSVGDWWSYAFVSRVPGVAFSNETKATLYYEISAVTPQGVLEEAVLQNNLRKSWAHTADTGIVNYGALLFAPLFLNFADLAPGQDLGDVKFQNYEPCTTPFSRCSFHARVGARERVTTGAGEFDAIPVNVRAGLHFVSAFGRTFYQEVELTFWYAAQAKRLVKARQTWKSGTSGGATDYDLELIAYGLQDGGGVGAKPASVLAGAPGAR